MPSVLPRGITRQGNLFVVEVRYRGHVATALEPSLFAAEIRKGQLLDALIAERPVGVLPPHVRPWTLENAYDRTVEMIWRHARGSQSAMRNAQDAMAYFGRYTLVKAITSHHIDLWVQALRKLGYSNSTVNRKLSALSRMIRFTHLRGGTDHLPIIIRKSEIIGRTRYLSEAEERQIFEILPRIKWHHDWQLFRFLLDTGLRVGEALRLQERDLNFKQKLIHVWLSKNDKPRSVPMTQAVYLLLKERIRGNAQRHPFPHVYSYYQKIWKQVRLAMGLMDDKEFVIHCLRHTCAARLVQNGVPLLVVQDWMGHKTFISTMRYAHLAPRNLREAAGVLDKATKKIEYSGSVQLQSFPKRTSQENVLSKSLMPTHPGAILRNEVLPELGINLPAMAAALGVSKPTVWRLINEEISLSARMAVRLGKYLGNGAEFWMSLQSQYELALARTELAKHLPKIPTVTFALPR